MVVKRSSTTEFQVVEIAGEDDTDFKSYDLGAAHTNAALGISGTSLTIWKLDGTCEIKFDSTSKPAIPLYAIIWPVMVVFERVFTNVYLTNSAQAGKTLLVYIGET